MAYKKFLFWAFLIVHKSIFCHLAITYQIAPGRIGDQLIYYCIAKDLAIKNNIDFYTRPFDYSNKKYFYQLNLSKLDKKFNSDLFKNYKIIEIGHELPRVVDSKKNILFIVSSKHWDISTKDLAWYGVSNNEKLRAALRLAISSPDIKTIQIPQGVISVAVQVRTGERYDDAALVQNYYEKFPPEKFYRDQIKIMREMYPSQKLYFYIFTDSYDPAAIVAQYRSYFNDPRMIFEARTAGSHDSFVLEDLFSMVQCDCLIRAKSALSVIAQLLGDHKVVLYPHGQLIK